MYLEDLCFNAQQAVEKAIKALLLYRGLRFPYVHDLTQLLSVLEAAGEEIPFRVHEAKQLTDSVLSHMNVKAATPPETVKSVVSAPAGRQVYRPPFHSSSQPQRGDIDGVTGRS